MHSFFESITANEITKSNRVLHTPGKFAKKCLFFVQEAGRLQSLKSHICQRENLDSFLFIIVLNGSGVVTFNNTAYTMNTGDCVLIDCKKKYSHQSSETNPWEIMWVHFNGKSAQVFFDEYSNITSTCIYTTKQIDKYTDIIEQLIGSHSKYANNQAELIDNKLITDMLTFCFIEASSSETISTDTTSQKLESIKAYIDNNFQLKLSLDDLAEKFFISKYHLSREFKNLFGITIGNYILLQRIAFAKKRLRFSNDSLEKIAEDCGIGDTNYFIKVFKKSENTTPLQYRKLWSH